MGLLQILLADDAEDTSKALKKKLEMQGYDVLHCLNGEDAWSQFQKRIFHICIIDIEMPIKDGISLAKDIRRADHNVPILLLTTRSQTEDRIIGLRAGADDYITKPFSLQELLLRIQIFVKRAKGISPEKPQIYNFGHFSFDPEEAAIYDKQNDLAIQLRPKECHLLQYLCDNANKKLPRKDILLAVWGTDDYFIGRSMDVYISRFRKHFKSDEMITIETLHGIGFRFNIPKFVSRHEIHETREI